MIRLTRWLVLVCALAAVTTRAHAQTFTGVAAVDSASVARDAWATAVKLYRQRELPAARRELDRASAAWPSQDAYVWYRAVFAAHAGDTAGVMDALGDYARLGLGRDLSDTIFDRFRPLPQFVAIAREHRAHRSALPRSRTYATLGDSMLWPEGVDHDTATGKLYVTSVRHRTIVEVDRDGREREILPRRSPGVGAMMGVRVDSRRRVLWATTVGMPQMDGWTPADTLAALLEIRIADGAILRRWTLDPSRRHLPGDLALGPLGDVLVSDSDAPHVYRLRASADSLETITSPLFRSLQGITASPDPGVVYVADYSHGLLRLDLSDGTVERMTAPAGETTLGIDGIAFHGGAIIAVQNGVAPARVMRFRLDGWGERIVAADLLDRNAAIADEPTIGTLVGDHFVYVANSQWEKYTPDGVRRAGTRLTPPVLLAVPLGSRR